MIQNRTKIGAVALTLGFAALIIVLLLTAVHVVGTDAELYYSQQMAAGILPDAGLSDDELHSLDVRLADYLKGNESALTEHSPFNEKEMTHMRDCYDLFVLLRKVRSRLIPWAVLLIAGGAYLLNDRRRACKVAWLSPLLLLVPLGAFAVYAALDFDRAFTLFHRILFQNDLWLLDPRTDLLIRICPQSMFQNMGLRIGSMGIAAMVAVPVLTTALARFWPRQGRGGKEQWNENRATQRAVEQKPKIFDVGGKR